MNEIKVKTSIIWIMLHYIRPLLAGVVVFATLDFLLLSRFDPIVPFSIGGAFLAVLLFLFVYHVVRARTVLHITPEGIFVDGYKINSYKISPVNLGQFIFVQSFSEKYFNVGRIRIRGTNFYFIGIPEYGRVKEYLLSHFGKESDV